MDLSFGEALLIFGSLLAVVAALSGLMRGTVLSASVLSIALGIVLAELDLVSVDVGDEGIVELIELALILTLVSDGLLVDRELLGRHWGPPARALVVAMPITLAPAWRSGRSCSSASSAGRSRSCSARCSAPTDPVVTSAVVTVQARAVVDPPHAQSRVRAQRRARASVRALLPGLGVARRRRRAARALQLIGEAAFGAVVGVALGLFGGWLHRVVPRRDHGALRGHLRDRLRPRRLRARRRHLRQRADRRLRARDHARPRPSTRSPSASPTSPRTSARSSRCSPSSSSGR